MDLFIVFLFGIACGILGTIIWAVSYNNDKKNR